MTDFEKLSIFELKSGGHESPDAGLCAMEAVAWLEGLPHNDHPSCTCQVIRAYVLALNDRLPHNERQRLVAYLPRLVGTVSPAHEWPRAQYLVGQSLSKAWPIYFRAFKLDDLAKEFEQIGEQWSGSDADLADLAALAVCAALAVRAVCAALAVRVVCAALAVLADCAALADLADCAARVAHADRAAFAALADLADRAALYDCHFEMLDGALLIGRQAQGFTHPIAVRVAAYKELVSA
jgi:hypothetical protein